MQASEKQISYAKMLGIDNPEQYDMKELSKVIDDKKGKKPMTASQSAPVASSKHDVVVTRTEKPHSYEFGKASSRHKIYYADLVELKEMVKQLKESGLIEEDEIETIKL